MDPIQGQVSQNVLQGGAQQTTLQAGVTEFHDLSADLQEEFPNTAPDDSTPSCSAPTLPLSAELNAPPSFPGISGVPRLGSLPQSPILLAVKDTGTPSFKLAAKDTGTPPFKGTAGVPKPDTNPTPGWHLRTYKGEKGYLFDGTAKLADYDWKRQEGKKTQEDIDALKAVTANEAGFFDTLNVYDNAILTGGIGQKTIDKFVGPLGKNGKPTWVHDGGGQLAEQIMRFKQQYANEKDPAKNKYKTLFEDNGWTVERDAKDGVTYLYYQPPDDPQAKPVKGEELRKILRQMQKTDAESLAYAKQLLQPFANALADPAFQDLQIADLNAQFKGLLRGSKPGNGKTYTHALGDYVSSQLGAALVLDHAINAGDQTAKNAFAKALDDFYGAHAKDKPPVSKNPADWGENRAAYEKEILKNYAGEGKSAGHRAGMTHAIGRRDAIIKAGLSDEPNSMKWQVPKK